MTSLLAWMPACLFCFTAGLLTCLSRIFTLSRTMTWFAAGMRTTLEHLPTDFTAADICKPTRLVFESFLPAHARLLYQVRAFRTKLLIAMAVVWDPAMTAIGRPFAIETAWWRTSATRQRRLKNSLSTMTADVLKDRFTACTTRSFVTQRRTSVIPTFEQTSTCSCADMLSFEAFINDAGRAQRSELAFHRLTL